MTKMKCLAIVGATLTKKNRIFIAKLLERARKGGDANGKRHSGESPQKG